MFRHCFNKPLIKTLKYNLKIIIVYIVAFCYEHFGTIIILSHETIVKINEKICTHYISYTFENSKVLVTAVFILKINKILSLLFFFCIV